MTQDNDGQPDLDADSLDPGVIDTAAERGAWHDTFDKFDPRLLESTMRPAMTLAKYFRTELEGVENLPWDRGCLCISNHAVMAIDSLVLIPSVYRATGRMLRALGEHTLFNVPIVSDFLLRLGAVDGNRDNAIKMMQAGKWVICYPGGVRDSFKRPEDRYQLKWHDRMGYLRCALAAGVPLVPIAGIGIDEAFVTLGHERRIGRRLFGSRRYDLPIVMGLGLAPLPVKFRFVIDQPIDIGTAFGLEREHADAPAEELLPTHAAIWSHTQGLIDRELARRQSRFF